MARTAAIPTRELSALSPNATAGPEAASTTPPMAGPTIRALVPTLELRATAFVRSSRPTVRNTSVCLAGALRASGDSPHEPERVDLPGGDGAREGEEAEQRRLRAEHALAGHDHAAQVDPVGDRAAERATGA